MKGYVSDSIAGSIDWGETHSAQDIKIKIYTSKNIIDGDLIKFSYGNKNIWKASIEKKDMKNFIDEAKINKIELIFDDIKFSKKLKNAQVTINREFSNNYTVTVEDAGS